MITNSVNRRDLKYEPKPSNSITTDRLSTPLVSSEAYAGTVAMATRLFTVHCSVTVNSVFKQAHSNAFSTWKRNARTSPHASYWKRQQVTVSTKQQSWGHIRQVRRVKHIVNVWVISTLYHPLSLRLSTWPSPLPICWGQKSARVTFTPYAMSTWSYLNSTRTHPHKHLHTDREKSSNFKSNSPIFLPRQ